MFKVYITFILLLLPVVSLAQVHVLIAYHSETGNTEKLANAVAEGAQTVEGIQITIKPVSETSESDLIQADAIIVGSPVYNANIAPAVSQFITSWPFGGSPLKDKIGAAFVTSGGISAGEEIVQMNILQSMLVFGMVVVGGPDWTQPFGASAITGETPFQINNPDNVDEQFLQKGRNLGKRVAEIALRMHQNH